MAGVIKGCYGYRFSNDNEEPVMLTVYGNKPIEEPEPEPEAAPLPIQKAEEIELPDFTPEGAGGSVIEELVKEAETVSVEEARIERELLTAEFEALRDQYERESERFVMRAREKATEIYEETKRMAEELIADAKAEAEEIRINAAKEARMKGYEEGKKQGYDDGYVKALKKCKDSLIELKETAESVEREKTEIFMQYERKLFDAVFEIAQAGKKYRTSKTVKIRVSELDIKEQAEIDEDLLKDTFRNCERVEIEIIKDAPEGTLIIDDGTEITDAGVMTQLKMIEQLGMGKYRDKTSSDIGRKKTVRKPRTSKKEEEISMDTDELLKEAFEQAPEEEPSVKEELPEINDTETE